MTPYPPAEAAVRLQALRIPLYLAPLILILMISAFIIANMLDLWAYIAVIALSLATVSFMRLTVQTARYQDYAQTKEFRIMRAIPYAAVPVVLAALVLQIIF
ncbi:UNVERIFIED_CONTAM: hypothetical protein Q9R71_35450 [Actinomycetes bacterium ARC8]|nr:hypothetical protein [Actinomycetes bacterium ARC8]